MQAVIQKDKNYQYKKLLGRPGRKWFWGWKVEKDGPYIVCGVSDSWWTCVRGLSHHLWLTIKVELYQSLKRIKW